jgi:hypothetical protein
MAAVGRQCVFLADGLGTRLRVPVETTAKPMLPVGGRPFLQQLVRSAPHRFGLGSFRISREASDLRSCRLTGSLEKFLRLVVPSRTADKTSVRWGEEMAA